MSRRPAPLPARFGRPVLAVEELLAAGVPRARLRAADLRPLRRGILARADMTPTEADLLAALCRQDPYAVGIGLTSARLQGFPLPFHLQEWQEDVPVRATAGARRRSSDGTVRWRSLRLAPGDVQHLLLRWAGCPDSPLRITSRARTWRDLAGELPHGDLVAIGDFLVRRPRPGLEGRSSPWCTREQLAAVCTGRRAVELRAALADVRIGADSPRETLLRLAFARAGLPEPLLNQPLLGPDGISRHSPDFQWPGFAVCVEYDGATHDEPGQAERDIRRARSARAAGFEEVRISAADVRNGTGPAVRLVRDALHRGGWRGDEALRSGRDDRAR